MATPTTLIPRQTAASTTTQMPLTTIFTPPAWCSHQPYTFFNENSGTSTFWQDINGPGDGRQSSCYPYSYAYQHAPGVAAEYSPGVCPRGYTGAQVEQNGAGGAVTSYCCPSGMTYATLFGCETLISTSTLVVLDSTTNVTMTEPFIAADWYIKAVWAPSDLSLFTPASAPVITTTSAAPVSFSITFGDAVTSSTSTPSSLSSSSTPASPGDSLPSNPASTQNPSPTASASPGLSTGAQAGIGAGAGVVAVAAIAALGLWLLRRRRRSGAQAEPYVDGKAEPYMDGKAELPGYAPLKTSGNGEQGEMYEVDGNGMPHEADNMNFRAELDGNWQGHEMGMNRK